MTDWNKFKVTDLRAELKKRGLPQAGLKPALVARLAEAENEEGSESEATVQALDASSPAATSLDTVSPIVPSADGLPDPPQTASEAVEDPEKVANLEEATQELSAPEVQSEVPVTQPAATIEFSQPPEASDDHKSALPSVDPREANEDQKKRKRRSQSPPPSATDSARKRFRADDDALEATSTHSDGGLVEQHWVDAGEVKPGADATAQDIESADAEMEDVKGEELGAVEGEDKAAVDMADKPEAEGTLEYSASRRDSRFKNLFPEPTTQASASTMGDIRGLEELETERNIPPAIHPATPALYIRDFMRPLNPGQLQAHLAHLAAPPGHEADPNVIIKFYIDPIRTHAFVSFAKVSAAARVRSALHDRIWPDEKTRKPLWVDFIPAEKVEQWIEQEQDTKSGGRSGGKKWEVDYHTSEDRVVTATLQEIGSIPRSTQSARQPSVSMSSPLKLQHSRNTPTEPLHIRGQATAFSTGRERLDVLFNCTIAKPALYWKTVAKAVADKRLDNIDHALSKDAAAGRPIQGDIHRYTFEEDTIVDRGPEIFPGIRPPPGFRGPSGFGPRGGASGGLQTRGGYPYRGGGHHTGGRGYDSYRGDRGGGRDVGGRGDWRDDRRSSRDYSGRY